MSNFPLDWFEENILDLIQTIAIAYSILIAVAELRKNNKAARVNSILEITSSHREIWGFALSDSELSRVLQTDVNLEAAPITPKEQLFINLLVAHVNYVYEAARIGLYDLPENTSQDIQEIFSLPIPHIGWNNLRDIYDSQFVKFMEEEPNNLRWPWLRRDIRVLGNLGSSLRSLLVRLFRRIVAWLRLIVSRGLALAIHLGEAVRKEFANLRDRE